MTFWYPLALLLLIVVVTEAQNRPRVQRRPGGRPGRPGRPGGRRWRPSHTWSKLVLSNDTSLNETMANQTALEMCSLPAIGGPCDGIFRYWYHDDTDDTCKEFFWSGCGGNNNRFAAAEECQYICGVEPEPTEEPFEPEDIDPVCIPAPESGECASSNTRWFHDIYDGMCKTFIYDGAQGNDNNFLTLDDCEMMCAPIEDDPFDMLGDPFDYDYYPHP